MAQPLKFSAEMYLWKSDASWYFVTLPHEVSDEIDFRYVGPKRGFGSIRVRVRVGDTTWDTSVFPSKEAESFVLPVKSQVREAEALELRQSIDFELEVRDQ